jgi:hypothetical protein
MNLMSLLSLTLGAIYLIGFAALIYCAKHAPEGYEDADGFRIGSAPGSASAQRTAADPAELDKRVVRMVGAA